MTEAKRNVLTAAYRARKSIQLLPDFEDNSAFVAHIAEQLRLLPTNDSRLNAMIEILAILNRFIRVQSEI